MVILRTNYEEGVLQMGKNLEVLVVTTVANELDMGNNQGSLRIAIIFLMAIMGNS